MYLSFSEIDVSRFRQLQDLVSELFPARQLNCNGPSASQFWPNVCIMIRRHEVFYSGSQRIGTYQAIKVVSSDSYYIRRSEMPYLRLCNTTHILACLFPSSDLPHMPLPPWLGQFSSLFLGIGLDSDAFKIFQGHRTPLLSGVRSIKSI